MSTAKQVKTSELKEMKVWLLTSEGEGDVKETHQVLLRGGLSLSQLQGPLFFPLREGDGTLLQYSRLENLMDGGAWWATVQGVTEGWT